jgi:A/G-specific adenine glycosylase
MDNSSQIYCMQFLGMDAALFAELPPLDHTFTHFKLRIYTQLLQIINRPRRKTDHEIWITLDDALQLAIPAPVRKILLKTVLRQQLLAH